MGESFRIICWTCVSFIFFSFICACKQTSNLPVGHHLQLCPNIQLTGNRKFTATFSRCMDRTYVHLCMRVTQKPDDTTVESVFRRKKKILKRRNRYSTEIWKSREESTSLRPMNLYRPTVRAQFDLCTGHVLSFSRTMIWTINKIKKLFQVRPITTAYLICTEKEI